MSKIKIGFIANDLSVGGVSAVLINLCNRLNKELYEVHLLLLSANQKMETIVPLDSSVHKHIFDYPFSDNYSLLSYFKAAFNKKITLAKSAPVLNKIADLNIDILHFHTLPRQLVIGQLAKKANKNLSLIYTDHLVRLEDSGYSWYQKLALEFAHKRFYSNYHVIAVSNAVLNSLERNGRHDIKCRLQLLENSINIEEYSRIKPLDNFHENHFIYVSRMNHHKGQDTLIKAWLKLNNPNKGKLVLVGPDESNGSFHKMAKEDDSIIFTGSISTIKQYLENSNYAVFPSQKEGLPISLLEKMAFELPVICSDIPELTSIISDHQEGIYFKLDHVDSLVEKLDFAINNKMEMIEMGKNARKKVEEICSINDPIQFHNKLYNQLITD